MSGLFGLRAAHLARLEPFAPKPKGPTVAWDLGCGAERLRFVTEGVAEDAKTRQAKDIGTVQRLQANFLFKAMVD